MSKEDQVMKKSLEIDLAVVLGIGLIGYAFRTQDPGAAGE